MKPGIGIAILLAVASLLSFGGVALGASSLSEAGSAAEAQYPPPPHCLDGPAAGQSGPESSTLGDEAEGPLVITPQCRKSKLPFTGSSILPQLLMLGAALLAAGIALRNVRLKPRG